MQTHADLTTTTMDQLQNMEDFLKKHYKLIVAGILGFMLAVSLLNAYNDAATFDEVAHIPASYSYLTEQDTRLNPEHPPLIKDLAAIPLVFMDLKFDTSLPFWTGELKNLWDEGQWAAGRHLLYEAGNDPNKIIFWSRVPIVILSLIFGLFLFKWGKEWFGILGGLFVLSLFAFDPNILGHNHYVTTDIGIAAFLTFAFYYFLRFLKDPTWKNTVTGGIFLGLLLVSKFSSIVILPIMGIALFAYALVRNNREQKSSRLVASLKNLAFYSGKSAVAFVVAMLVVWIIYAFNTANMPQEVFAQTVNFFFPADPSNFKSEYTNKALLTLGSHDLSRPFAAYLLGPAWVFKRVAGGNGAYFLGEVSNSGFRSYFPVVFLIKETLPFLLLIVLALAYTAFQAIRTTLASLKSPDAVKQSFANIMNFLRTGLVQYTLFGFIILYAYLSISGNLNIGFRHLFPILPFAYLLVTKKVFDFIKTKPRKTRHALHMVLVVLVLWLAVNAVAVYPGYVSYFNESVGGSKNGYRYVTDSNTDWGQDLKRLKIYLDEHPEIGKIRVDYFGGGNPKQLLGDKYIQWWDSMRPVQSGWYAISTNFLQGSIYDAKKTQDDSYRWTLDNTPVAQIGNSILIYHIPEIEK